MKTGKRSLLALLLAALFWNTDSSLGQETAGPKKFSLKAAPLPACKSFLMTEVGLGYRLNPPPKFDDDQHLYFNWDFGVMFNQNERSAIGGSVFLGIDDAGTGTRLGIKPRYRRWLSRTSSLDFSPGIFVVLPENSPSKFLGLSGQVGLNLSDWFAFTGQLEFKPSEGEEYNPTAQNFQRFKEKDVALWGGVRLGSKPGLVVSGLSALAGLIVLAVESGGGLIQFE